MTDEDVFAQAIQIPVNVRDAYVASVCGDDPERNERICRLLKAHESRDSFLQKAIPDTDMAATVDALRVGQMPIIGNYKLREQIGEGGMGSVFVAEQQRPVRRMVALKLIKTGMDTKDVIARFEAERQALAMMDHPNIAKVLDAGTTETGRPYFVMELVRGIPITQYCDEQKLNIRQRLELFTQVCRAIQHARQKGIIHRDIKPSNVLVTEHDGQPVPKVIDFGVAKAIGHRLTEQTIYTHHLQPVGTLLYMSPEQSRLSGLDIDTRSDVYSLGLLLYELLTGTMPFDRETFDKASFDEKRRIIAEDEAPRPSTRISTLGHTTSKVTETRRTDAVALQKELRGELDWILIKALEKDRNRRYDSPNHLAEDVSNYLTGDIVEARPPSRAYQLQKFYRKNRAILTGGTVVIMALIVSLGAVSWGSHTAWELKGDLELEKLKLEENEAKLSKQIATLQTICIDRAIGDALSGNIARAQLSIDQAREAQADEPLLKAIEGLTIFFSGDTHKAIGMLKTATELNPDCVEAWSILFWATLEVGDYGQSEKCRQKLQDLDPQTEWQRLFKVITNLWSRPHDALREMNDLADKHPLSAIIVAFKAKALESVGFNDNNLERLRESIAHFERADSLLPSTFFVQSNYLRALTSGIELAKSRISSDSTNAPELATWEARGRQIAKDLAENPSWRLQESLAAFYLAVGDEDQFHKVIEKGAIRTDVPSQIQFSRLFGNEQHDEISKLASGNEEWEFVVYKAFIEIDQAKSPIQQKEIAQRAFDRVALANSGIRDNSAILLSLDLFLFAGDLDGMRKNALQLKSQSPDFLWTMFGKTLDYLVDPSADREAEFLKSAGPFREQVSWANYYVGLVALARGYRPVAIERFKTTVSLGCMAHWAHVWAAAFLKRMENDENWPQWINAE